MYTPNHVSPSRGSSYTSCCPEVMKRGGLPPLWPNKIITTDLGKFFKGWGKGKHLSFELALLWGLRACLTTSPVYEGKIEWIPAAGICYIMVYNTPGINNAWLNRLCPDFRTKLLSPLQKVLDGKMFPSISQCSIIANFLAAMSLIYHFPFSQTLNGEKILHLSKNASLVKNSYCLPFGYLATMSFMNS